MIDLKLYGYIESEIPEQGLIPGRVTDIRRERYTVITEHGETSAALKGTLFYSAQIKDDLPCVGDFVLLQYNETGVSQIAVILPRRTQFFRADFLGHKVGYVKTVYKQIVASNFDYVFIVTSLNQDYNVNRVLRYLTQAQRSGGEPVVILSKADLADDFATQIVDIRKVAADVPVHAVSSHTGYGMKELDKYIQPGKTIIFMGMSGVGKSSLLNALMNQEVMEVKAIREDDSRGRHTTTHRQLFKLPSGALVIDTPGMRELGLYDAEEAIGQVFSNVEELFARCRFSDCRHNTEPGCAVKEALADGSLTEEQWERYLAQIRENRYVDDKLGYLREVRARGKAIAEFSKKNKYKKGTK